MGLTRVFSVIVLVIAILSYFAWKDIPAGEGELLKTEAVQITREVIVKEPISKELCEDKKFRYSFVGGDVLDSGGFVSPNLILINQEERWGVFKVNFSYFDESRFPYSVYGGQNLQMMLRSGNFSHEYADMRTEDYEISLGPTESHYINPATQKPRQGRFWAIASVKEPMYTTCRTVNEYVEVAKNMTFTQEPKGLQYRTVTLEEKFGVNFPTWLLSVLIIFLLILLFLKKTRADKTAK